MTLRPLFPVCERVLPLASIVFFWNGRDFPPRCGRITQMVWRLTAVRAHRRRPSSTSPGATGLSSTHLARLPFYRAYLKTRARGPDCDQQPVLVERLHKFLNYALALRLCGPCRRPWILPQSRPRRARPIVDAQPRIPDPLGRRLHYVVFPRSQPLTAAAGRTSLQGDSPGSSSRPTRIARPLHDAAARRQLP